MTTRAYRNALRALLTPAERRIFARLDTPQKVQAFLEDLPPNFELEGETNMSPRRVLKARTAHCAEARVFAAAVFAYHGQPAWLMDMRALPSDQDHVVTLFKQRGLWGAISKTNHAVLRWRDPIYRSPRELAMSYAHEYCLDGGKKSLLAFSRPFNLTRYKPRRWVTADGRPRLADGGARQFAASAARAGAGAEGARRTPRSNCCRKMWSIVPPNPRQPKLKAAKTTPKEANVTSFILPPALTVAWGHCDPAGIIFNPRFFEMFDVSSWMLFEAALGVKAHDLARTYGIVGIALVDAKANFLKPVKFGDQIEMVSGCASSAAPASMSSTSSRPAANWRWMAPRQGFGPCATRTIR